ncbi:MAG: hypothetical protein NZ922_04125 [Candidatus Methanomethyliaceae archaeon]|nr:hypothetical protein [Candidatus Methanomethyliaceae archaeon]MDW7970623.1 hypothetical protein [Nitrososphaerota archaeon]
MISKRRIIAGIITFIVLLILLSYIPLRLKEVLINYLDKYLSISQFISSILPIIGVILAVSIALSVVLKKTKAYGLTIIISSILWILYIYVALNGGQIYLTINYPYYFIIIIDFKFLMFMIFIPILLDLIKGIIIALKRK